MQTAEVSCDHRERRQARDPETGEPTGPMTCVRCEAEVKPRAVGEGRCSVCGGLDGVRLVEIPVVGGKLTAHRCRAHSPE